MISAMKSDAGSPTDLFDGLSRGSYFVSVRALLWKYLLMYGWMVLPTTIAAQGVAMLQLGGGAGAPVVEERSNVRQGNRAAVAHPNQSVAQGDIAPELCKGVRALLPAVFLQHLEQSQEPFALCEPAAGRRRLGRRGMMVKLGEFSRGMSCL